jgi:GntR family negative regulator for fad regulon and positive regulator of fabA
MKKPLKPAEFVENRLITDIISGVFPKNSKLPGERTLAEMTGVTRPTLREALQRLSRDGWITINHGKQTVVNDFWDKGGLGILRTLIDYIDLLPKNLLSSMLEFRTIVFPEIAELAYKRDPETIIKFLEGTNVLATSEDFAAFDWKLQLLIAKSSGNTLFPLILNDFTKPFNHFANIYFKYDKAKVASQIYYKKLRDSFSQEGSDIKEVVKDIMANSNLIWEEYL